MTTEASSGSPRRARALPALCGLAGWLAAGALIGSAVGALSVRENISLRGAGQALPFVAWITAGYCLALGLIGALPSALLFFERRSRGARAVFVSSLIAAFGAFATFSAMQAVIANVNWRSDSNPQNVAASLVLGAAIGIALRIVLLRSAAPVLERLFWFVASCVLLASAGFWAAGFQDDSRGDLAAPKDVARPDPTPRVMLIGVDGLDWARLQPLIDCGRLPAFKSLCDGAYRGPLQTRKPTWSPIVWNTIATGVPEDVHGVLDFTELELPGLERGALRLYPKMGTPAVLPRYTGLAAAFRELVDCDALPEFTVSGLHRRTKAFWNVISERGVKSAVIRWWGTWPAEQIDGFVVSDNDPLARIVSATKSNTMDVNATDAYMTWPSELAGEILPLIRASAGDPRTSESARDEILRAPELRDLAPDDLKALRDTEDRSLLRWFDLIVRGDRFATDCALRLWNDQKVDMCAVYLRAVDNLSHRMWRFGGVIDHTYEMTDGLLAELVAAAGPNTTIVLVSDHGWCYEPGPLFGHNHAPPGVVVIHGPEVVAGECPSGAKAPTVLDVMPTMLALYGLPPSADLHGRALREAFRPDSLAGAERAAVPSWGPYRPRWASRTGPVRTAEQGGDVGLLHHLGYLDQQPSQGR